MADFRSILRWVLLSVYLVIHLLDAASSNVIRFADTVWEDSRPEALNALYSPFVVSLAAGNLVFESYAQYIYQDAQYAKAAADANVVAMNYAVDPRAKEIFAMFNDSNARGAVSFQEWLDEHRPNVTYPINNATKNYTNFLNNTVHGRIEGYPAPFTGPIVSVFSLASFIPCWKLYYFIGKHIVAAVGDYQGNPYRDWIYSNSKDSLGVKLAKIDGVFEYLAANLTRAELAIVEQVYRKGMTCEIEFFLAQPLFQNTSVPLTRDLSNATERLLMFSSFDGASSVVDSSATLASLAISSAKNKSQLKAKWAHHFSQYKEDYGLGVENISSSAKTEAFHYYKLSKALGIFSHIESANILRVNESRALAGIQVKAIASAGEDMILVQDFITFFQRIVKRQNLNSTANVISTSWSASLIKAAFSSVDLKKVQVHANELAVKESGFSDGIIEYEVLEDTLHNHYGLHRHANALAADGSVSTGGIIDTIVSPADKVKVLEDIVKNYTGENKLTVYVGESVEDLLSLLSADIGIVIEPSSSLKRVGTQLGVSFKSLFSGSINVQERTVLERRPDWTGSPGVLYTVSSWTEIDAFVLGWNNNFETRVPKTVAYHPSN